MRKRSQAQHELLLRIARDVIESRSEVVVLYSPRRTIKALRERGDLLPATTHSNAYSLAAHISEGYLRLAMRKHYERTRGEARKEAAYEHARVMRRAVDRAIANRVDPSQITQLIIVAWEADDNYKQVVAAVETLREQPISDDDVTAALVAWRLQMRIPNA